MRDVLLARIFPPKHLQGRAGAARAITSTRDVCFLVGYLLTNHEAVRRKKQAAQSYEWFNLTLNCLPNRCTPIVLVDANGHIGFSKDSTVRGELVRTHGTAFGWFNGPLENPSGK